MDKYYWREFTIYFLFYEVEILGGEIPWCCIEIRPTEYSITIHNQHRLFFTTTLDRSLPLQVAKIHAQQYFERMLKLIPFL